MPDVQETFFFFFFFFFFLAENFSGSKDTEPYKTDVSFLCQYINNRYLVSKANNLLSGNYFYLRLIRLYEKPLHDKAFPFSDIDCHGNQI